MFQSGSSWELRIEKASAPDLWSSVVSRNLSLFIIICNGILLIYNVVLFSAVQQSESAICIPISPLFWISFLCRLPQSPE